MFNCIYSSGVVWPSETAACPYNDSVLGGNGADLVDVTEDKDWTNVYTDPPVDQAGFTTLGWGLLIGVGLLWLSGKRG